MRVCNYCGRYLKNKYDNCPACGSKDFKTVQNYGEIKIDKPPKDGYKVNLDNFYYQKKQSKPVTMIGFYIVLCVLAIGGPMVIMGTSLISTEDSDFPFSLIFLLVFVGFVLYAMLSMLAYSRKVFKASKDIKKNAQKDINKVQYLSKNGVLVKNLKYEIKPVKESINGRKTTYTIRVIYEIEKGKTKCFDSEPKYLSALGRDDGTVDLLFDPKDPSNYFIDFEIY